MKNLQKNQSAIGPQSYRLAERINGKDTYIYDKTPTLEKIWKFETNKTENRI